jgi:uncharacterized protein
MTYRILSFDGGGVRGAYTATLLSRLVSAKPQLVADTSLLAGTSTGGIIALGLAAGFAPSALVKLYQDQSKIIFDRSFTRDIAKLHGLNGADYSNENLKQILSELFGPLKLRELIKRVLVPSFHLDDHASDINRRQWKPKFFHNCPGDSDDGEKVMDVAMRTTAAPIYFPSYGEYIDGGVVANDPSMAALAQALRAGEALHDIRLLSISTGRNAVFIAGCDHDWGIAEWAKPLVSLMIDGVMGVTEFQCDHILGARYFRLEPPLPRAIAMDDASAVCDLIEYANAVDMQPAIEWVGRNW